MDLAELYRDVIVDHNRSPRNRGRLAAATHHAEGDNPLCGDRLRLDVDVAGDVIRDLRFEGSGCAISTAAASLMSEAVKGSDPFRSGRALRRSASHADRRCAQTPRASESSRHSRACGHFPRGSSARACAGTR